MKLHVCLLLAVLMIPGTSHSQTQASPNPEPDDRYKVDVLEVVGHPDDDIEVTAYDPPTRYAFLAIAGPARPVGEYRFAPSGAGTEVTFSLRAELGGLKKLLMSGPVQKTMDGEMQALDAAKAKLEGG